MYSRNITSNELSFRIAVDEPSPAKERQAFSYDVVAHYKTWGMGYYGCVCRHPRDIHLLMILQRQFDLESVRWSG